MAGQDKHAFLVLTEPVKGREDEYNDWYDNVHVVDVAAVPGFKSAQRYELSSDQLDGYGEDAPLRYLAIYEIEGDAGNAFAGLLGGVGDGSIPMSEALDPEKTKCWNYTLRDAD